MTNHDRKLFYGALRNDFQAFLHQCVKTLNPGTRFLPNWHIDAIAHVLQQVQNGDLTRLIINMPPRYLKSITASVAFPAFLLGHNPYRRIICISYGNDLSAKHAVDFRAIVTSPWYRAAFPGMKVTRATDMEVHTSARGFRKATSVHAALTGLGGEIFIIDDPQKPVEAQSDPLRNQLNQWFHSTLISRLDNKQTGAIIVVQQRVHLQDLTGFLIESSGEWHTLALPAIAEEEQIIAIGNGRSYRRRQDEALHPEHESLETLQQLRSEIGSDIFAAQYQQTPVPAGGNMIQRKWLRYYDTLPERKYGTKLIQSWDLASKDGLQNDWSVCVTVLLCDKHYYVVDVLRDRFDYPRLAATARALIDRHKPDVVLIEDSSIGPALEQDLRRSNLARTTLVKPVYDKRTRLYLQQAKFEASRVLFPRQGHFIPELETELILFPQSRFDDQVDALTQALAYEPTGYDTTLRWVG